MRDICYSLTMGVSWAVFVNYPALGSDQDLLDAIAREAKTICTQPETRRQHWSFGGDVDGGVGVQLKQLKVPGISGSIHFSADEWRGIQLVLPEHQEKDNENYRQCAKELAEIFVEKLLPVKPKAFPQEHPDSPD